MDTIPISLPILMDGATGTELRKRGMPAGVCTEQWVLEHPQVLLEVQRGYVRAGSRVLLAPTFGANRASLERSGVTGQVGEYNRRLVELTRQAAGALSSPRCAQPLFTTVPKASASSTFLMVPQQMA